jgi:hypothetical protein
MDPAWFQRLKLEHDKLLSNVAFNCNLRPYTPDTCEDRYTPAPLHHEDTHTTAPVGMTEAWQANFLVGRCRLTPG